MCDVLRQMAPPPSPLWVTLQLLLALPAPLSHFQPAPRRDRALPRSSRTTAHRDGICEVVGLALRLPPPTPPGLALAGPPPAPVLRRPDGRCGINST